MASNPMYQFNVYRIGPEIKLGSVDISFTNASLFMVISSLAILIIFNLGAKKKTLIPDKLQLMEVKPLELHLVQTISNIPIHVS